MATLLETWRNLAYGDGLDDKKREELWTGYFTVEKGIYEKILSDPAQVVEGTVKELAEKYETEVLIMTGFLDGINESLKGYENPIETMDENTPLRSKSIRRSCTTIWWKRRRPGCMAFPSGKRSSLRKRGTSFIRPRRLPVQYAAKAIRSTPTIRVPAEVVKNIKSAADGISKKLTDMGALQNLWKFCCAPFLREGDTWKHIRDLRRFMIHLWIMSPMGNGANT